MSKTSVKKFIDSLSHDELKEMLLSLYDQSDLFHEMMDGLVSQEKAEKQFKRYSTKLDKVFSNPMRFSLDKAISIVREYESITSNNTYSALMNLHLALLMAEFTNDYGDMSDSFYEILEEKGLNAIQYAKEDSTFYKNHAEEIETLIKECGAFGWGVSDSLRETWDQIPNHK